MWQVAANLPSPEQRPMSATRARAALAMLVVAFVVGLLALPEGLVLIVTVGVLIAIAPKGKMREVLDRARGREFRVPVSRGFRPLGEYLWASRPRRRTPPGRRPRPRAARPPTSRRRPRSRATRRTPPRRGRRGPPPRPCRPPGASGRRTTPPRRAGRGRPAA